jgi:hypothetical protein
MEGGCNASVGKHSQRGAWADWDWSAGGRADRGLGEKKAAGDVTEAGLSRTPPAIPARTHVALPPALLQ